MFEMTLVSTPILSQRNLADWHFDPYLSEIEVAER